MNSLSSSSSSSSSPVTISGGSLSKEGSSAPEKSESSASYSQATPLGGPKADSTTCESLVAEKETDNESNKKNLLSLSPENRDREQASTLDRSTTKANQFSASKETAAAFTSEAEGNKAIETLKLQENVKEKASTFYSFATLKGVYNENQSAELEPPPPANPYEVVTDLGKLAAETQSESLEAMVNANEYLSDLQSDAYDDQIADIEKFLKYKNSGDDKAKMSKSIGMASGIAMMTLAAVLIGSGVCAPLGAGLLVAGAISLTMSSPEGQKMNTALINSSMNTFGMSQQQAMIFSAVIVATSSIVLTAGAGIFANMLTASTAAATTATTIASTTAESTASASATATTAESTIAASTTALTAESATASSHIASTTIKYLPGIVEVSQALIDTSTTTLSFESAKLQASALYAQSEMAETTAWAKEIESYIFSSNDDINNMLSSLSAGIKTSANTIANRQLGLSV